MKEANVRKLIEIFQESGVEELEYRESFWRGIRLRLSRSRRVEGGTTVLQAPAAAVSQQTTPTAPVASDVSAAAPVDDGLHAVTSPMVGTFYRSPSPDADPFVSVGDRVKAGQTICIIEAMKIMNEIEADVDGEVVEADIDSGHPVEYGQILFRIRPA